MIFKFDKSGNMENVSMEGDIQDMAKKKDRLAQMDMNVVNQVKEEVLNTMTETAAGFESLDEIVGDEDMVQKEMSESEVWDRGSRDGMIDNGEKPMPAFGSLSEKMRTEESSGDDREQMKVEEFNETRNILQNDKDELKRKRDENKAKKQMRERLDKLSSSLDKSWDLENCQIVLRDNKPYKYTVSLSCMQLAEMYISGILIYDPDVQRGSKTNKKGEEVPILFLKHCREIRDSILDGSIHGGNLSLNFPTDNNAELFYDKDSMTLSGNGPITINDGMHRIYASYLWYKEYIKPNSTCKSPESFYFPANVEHLSKQASCDLFKEYAVMGKSISKNRISVHNVFDKNYEITQRVIKESQLRGRVEMISNSIKKNSPCIITYGTILNGISEFNITTKGKEEEIGNFIIEFIDYLIELFPSLMGNVEPEFRALEKQKSFVLEKMFQNSYFVLASKLQSRNDWKERLFKLTQGNFLSRNNPQFKFCLRDEDKIINSSKIQKDITRIICERVLTS